MKKISFVLLLVSALVMTGCNKEKLITLTTSTTTMHHGETYQIPAQCDNPMTFASDDEYHAKVSPSGVITANYVGSTTIQISSKDDNKTFNVTVAPTSNLYQDPRIDFRDPWTTVVANLGEPDATMDNTIAYYDYSTAAEMLLVSFDEFNKVDFYALVVNNDYSNELSTFLGERYDYLGASEGMALYRNGLTESTTTMYIGMQPYNENYWMVVYISAADLKSPAVDKALKTVKELL